MTTTTEPRPITTHTAGSAGRGNDGRHAAPSARKSAAWRTWDWANLALGIHLILAPLWVPGATTARFPIAGLLVSAVALWGLATASSLASEVTMSIVAFATYFSSHIGLHETAPRWTLWLTGLAVFVVAMYATKERQVRR